jgi:hypothetical protein
MSSMENGTNSIGDNGILIERQCCGQLGAPLVRILNIVIVRDRNPFAG